MFVRKEKNVEVAQKQFSEPLSLGIKRLWFKLGEKVGNVEQTKMSPDYIEREERYDGYKTCVDMLVERMEYCLQQNQNVLANRKVDAPPGQNPYEQLAKSLLSIVSFLPKDKQKSIQQMIATSTNLAVLQRDEQVTGRHSIRHLRRFYLVEYKELMEERKHLERLRIEMDQTRHNVKMSNTTEKIEKFALLYEQAVNDFDAQARRVIELFDRLPNIKKVHLNDIKELFVILRNFNQKSAEAINLKEYE
ncbi:hypothetical protein AB6A40_000582 [Gnathostoma spinigerum]|uniref:BAR domain-containing protein n=1 Tax=Gnathostoma spinigerum TaxID=75299 RepID=A0ABD6EAU2_9BILA